MKNLRFLLGVDGVLANFLDKSLEVAFRLSGKKILPEHVTEYNFIQTILEAQHHEAFWREVSEAGACSRISPYPGSQEFVDKINARYDLYIVTSPLYSSQSWGYERVEWLKQHYGIKASQVISTAAKHVCRGDIFLEDSPTQLNKWMDYHPDGLAIMWDQPYNRKINWEPRAQTFEEVLTFAQRKAYGESIHTRRSPETQSSNR